MPILSEFNSFYIFADIVIIVSLLYIIFISVYYPHYLKNKVIKVFVTYKLSNNLDFTLTRLKVDGSDLLLTKNGKKYYIKILNVKAGCDLQINNFETFVMYSSNGQKGKALPDMHNFMSSKKENRILVLSSEAKTIKKVINESEMIMVNNNTNIYNTRLINFNMIDEFIKNL